MFTGIVEEVGTIDTISRGANSAVLTIRAEKVLDGTKVGDSIAVNGICLTVTRLMPHAFTADVMHETLNRSSLANALRGAHVNLERAMAADGRFGAADFKRIERQIANVAPYADKIIGYQYIGLMNPEDSGSFAGHESSAELYRQYAEYLKK